MSAFPEEPGPLDCREYLCSPAELRPSYNRFRALGECRLRLGILAKTATVYLVRNLYSGREGVTRTQAQSRGHKHGSNKKSTSGFFGRRCFKETK